MKTQNPIIVALDGMDSEKSLGIVDKIIRAGLYNHGVWGVKVEEPPLNERSMRLEFLRKGIRVFSDPKLFIPLSNRVEATISYYTPSDFISICATMPTEAMRMAVKAAYSSRIVALLVPTSFDNATCQSKYGRDIEGATYEFAIHAKLAGVQGLIVPPRELKMLRKYEEFHEMWWLTPAIRFGDQMKGAHQEVMTPREALENGADLLVIGSPITEAQDEIKAIKEVLKEIKDFLP